MLKIIKVTTLSIINAIVIWMGAYLISSGILVGLGITILSLMVLIDYFTLSAKGYPFRYMIPAIALLFILVLYPIYFTIKTAFTNYGTGHLMTKQEAIERLIYDPNYIYTTEASPSWRYSVYTSAEDFVILFKKGPEEYISFPPKPVVKRGREVLLRRGKLEKIPFKAFPKDDPRYLLISGKTYRKFYDPDDEMTHMNSGEFGARIVQKFLYRSEFITPEDEKITIRIAKDGKWRFFKFERLYRVSFEMSELKSKPTRKMVIVNTLTGKKLIEKDGTFYDISKDGSKKFVIGYIDFVGWRNFLRIIKDPNISRPFLKIFSWTFTWATLSVLFTFAIGLVFALVLNDRTLKGRTIYRTLLIIPWAIPAFISVLVWKNGMFNETYGVINRFVLPHLGLSPIKWFNDPLWAKVAVLMVNTWLGFPYMMTVSLGALQSIPDELYEAAQIDGAGKWKRFWKITFPLLMTTVSPLLVGSFAFNFNNFVNIYLLTGGGPPLPNTSTPAGATDILISYTYKLAFEGGRGQDFGFASAISMIIFLIVAGISFVNFKISGSFEENLK